MRNTAWLQKSVTWNGKEVLWNTFFDRICPSSRPQGANPVRSSSRLIPQQVKTAIHWLVPISSLCDRGCAQWGAWVSPRISELCKLTTVGHGTTAPLLLVQHKNSWARKHMITLPGWVIDSVITMLTREYKKSYQFSFLILSLLLILLNCI